MITNTIVQKILEGRRAEYDWSLNARPEQLPPPEWSTWLILAGRGFGKTRTGAETVRKLVAEGQYKRICLLGEAMHEVRRIMIEGKSGLLSVHPNHARPKYYPSLDMLMWKSGAVAYAFSAENSEALRGPEFDLVWIDELAKFRDPGEVLNQIRMTLRLGKAPKLIITTTPKPIPIIKKLLEDKSVSVTRGSTLDNSKNLPEAFLETILQEYGSTKFGLQEIYGEVVEDDHIQLWSKSNIRYDLAISWRDMEELIISVDPSVTCNAKSDETGIIVAGRLDDHYYVFEDVSFKGGVLDWASIVVSTAYKYGSVPVVIEVNQGGNLAKELILQIDPTITIYEVRASKSKLIRAQPVASLYSRGLVYHTRIMDELEDQLLNFTLLSHSPDRADALIWAITHLRKCRSKFSVVF